MIIGPIPWHASHGEEGNMFVNEVEVKNVDMIEEEKNVDMVEAEEEEGERDAKSSSNSDEEEEEEEGEKWGDSDDDSDSDDDDNSQGMDFEVVFTHSILPLNLHNFIVFIHI
jgi:hypothetical protein